MDLIKNFLTIQNNIRMYHWTTSIYNQHVVSGELYEKLDSLFDKFIETYLGKFDKNNLQFSTLSIEMNSESILKQLKRFKQFLMTDLNLLIKSKDSDLKNIRDDILGEINRFLFLLRLS